MPPQHLYEQRRQHQEIKDYGPAIIHSTGNCDCMNRGQRPKTTSPRPARSKYIPQRAPQKQDGILIEFTLRANSLRPLIDGGIIDQV